MRRYLCSIMQLSQAFSRRYLGNHFSAIRARHLRGLHISRSPMPFGRPARVHSIAIINESRYTTFFHSPILSFTDFPILFRCNPSPSRSPLPPSLPFLSEPFSASGTEEEKNLQFQLSRSMLLADPSPRKIRFPPRDK